MVPMTKGITTVKPLLIGVCGRSCSGKGAVTESIASKNKQVIRICQDSYFKINTPIYINSNNYTDGYWDIDDPQALMMDRLIDAIERIKKVLDVKIPSAGWTENFNVEITTRDLTTRPIILVEGFLLFIYDQLASLFDSRIFVDVTDLNILYRRLRRDKSMEYINYIYDIVIPNSLRDETQQKNNCDAIVDGNLSREEVLSSVEGYLNHYVLKAPNKMNRSEEVWQVKFGDLICDHKWHPLDVKDLKTWAQSKASLRQMDIGAELFGHTFIYRKSKNVNGQYELRLNDGCNLFRYTPELTSGLASF